MTVLHVILKVALVIDAFYPGTCGVGRPEESIFFRNIGRRLLLNIAGQLYKSLSYFFNSLLCK